MVETKEHFIARLNGLAHKRARMTGGYVTRVGRDGLLTVKPRRRRGGLPVRGLALLVCGFFVFKALMLASIGPVTYNERLAKLDNGTTLEQMGARVLSIDPVTLALADFAGPAIR